MERVERFKSQQIVSCTIKRRLVSGLFVIVNFTTLIINLNYRQVETSSLSNRPLPQLNKQATSHRPITSSLPQNHLKVEPDFVKNEGREVTNSDLKLANNLDQNALMYLQRYGYMNAHSNAEANNLISEDSFSDAISNFQRFAGIPETGIVDNQTLRYMQMPRCGNVDRVQVNGSSRIRAHLAGVVRRKKRYALQGSKWRRQELTYRISQYPTRFNGKRHEVDSQIEKAFGIWSQVSPIDFVVKRDGRVHIDIRFASGDHGDGDAFDGPGNTLAHAYFPQYGGDAHFDDQEFWTVDSYAGTNIFQVAAHELGHSLGLGHSNVREALMAPFYQKYKPNFKLHIDDVLAIQALYGEKPFLPEVPQTTTSTTSQPTTTAPTTTSTASTTTTTTTTTTTAKSQSPTTRFSVLPHGFGRNKPGIFGFSPKHPDSREMNDDEDGVPDLSTLGGNGIGMNGAEEGSTNFHSTTNSGYPADLCVDPNIDTVTRTEDGSSYVFKGDFYWLLTSDGLAKGYPRKISADWDGLPGSLDAALTWADGKTFFFKGNKYWRYRNRRRDVGYPKLISAGFAGIPDDIDAAFVWSGNGRTYIFKGSEYWRFDSKADPPVSNEYPRSIKVWNGIPSHINAAFRWENNVTYFFKGSQYYRFNDKEFKVESRGRPPFPRLSSEWWFGCISSNLAQKALSSSLRENNSTAENQDLDWSFFAGLEESTRIMGTHISDHKPGSISNNSDNKTKDPPNTSQILGHRIGLYNPSTVSSSAISIGQSNLVVLFCMIMITISISLANVKLSSL